MTSLPVTTAGPSSVTARRLAEEFPFFLPQGWSPEMGLPPRGAVQLVDAPPGQRARFVVDPTGVITRFLSGLALPLKVIGVAGTFR